MESMPKKALILENGIYIEITYKELCDRRKTDSSYKDRNFISIEDMLVEVTKEVFTDYMRGERKKKYMEVDLTTERVILNVDGTIKKVFPSREDSLERLIEDNARQFADKSVDVEENALRNILIEKLHIALSMLSEDEYALIYALYFENQTEREYAEKLGVYRNAIHVRKNKILKKLKKFLK